MSHDPIVRLDAAAAEARLDELADLLVDAVASGASVHFLAGLDRATARAWWSRAVLPGLRAGDRILFAAERAGRLVGTVQLVFAAPPNQPHRADIAKMIVHREARGGGLGARLLAEAEAAARETGRTLLVLDTEADSAGERLYRRCGWTPVGVIPGYALTPDGRPAAASVLYKDIAERPESARAADVVIRDAAEADLAAILAIHNDAVATTTAIWSETPADLANRRTLLDERRARGLPFLVAEEPGTDAVMGYASFGDFRPWPGYCHTVEHSVYVSRDHRRRGVARVLLAALVERASALGMHAMVAGIEAGNGASLALHAEAGFREVGRLPEVGRKFDRWLDLVLMQRTL